MACRPGNDGTSLISPLSGGEVDRKRRAYGDPLSSPALLDARFPGTPEAEPSWPSIPKVQELTLG